MTSFVPALCDVCDSLVQARYDATRVLCMLEDYRVTLLANALHSKKAHMKQLEEVVECEHDAQNSATDAPQINSTQIAHTSTKEPALKQSDDDLPMQPTYKAQTHASLAPYKSTQQKVSLAAGISAKPNASARLTKKPPNAKKNSIPVPIAKKTAQPAQKPTNIKPQPPKLPLQGTVTSKSTHLISPAPISAVEAKSQQASVITKVGAEARGASSHETVQYSTMPTVTLSPSVLKYIRGDVPLFQLPSTNLYQGKCIIVPYVKATERTPPSSFAKRVHLLNLFVQSQRILQLRTTFAKRLISLLQKHDIPTPDEDLAFLLLQTRYKLALALEKSQTLERLLVSIPLLRPHIPSTADYEQACMKFLKSSSNIARSSPDTCSWAWWLPQQESVNCSNRCSCGASNKCSLCTCRNLDNSAGINCILFNTKGDQNQQSTLLSIQEICTFYQFIQDLQCRQMEKLLTDKIYGTAEKILHSLDPAKSRIQFIRTCETAYCLLGNGNLSICCSQGLKF